MEEADQLCDRVAIMDHGVILALDTPDAAQGSRPARRRSCTVTDRPRRRRPPRPPPRRGHRRGDRLPARRRRSVAAVGQPAPGCCRGSSPRPSRSASPSPTCRSSEPDARDRLHQPDREGPARMTTTVATAGRAAGPPRRWSSCARPASPTARPSSPCCSATSTCCSRASPLFIVRAVMQPLLLMFVFTYVFPKIGQGVGGGGGEEAFTATLVAGVVGLAIVFQGIQSVALPLVQEFGYSKEIEDRVLAPLPTKAGRHPEDRHRRAQLVVRRAARVPDRVHRPGDDRAPAHPLADAAHPGPARRLGGRRPRARARDQGGAAAGVLPVRPRRAPDHVPRLHLLPVAGAEGGAGCRSSC